MQNAVTAGSFSGWYSKYCNLSCVASSKTRLHRSRIAGRVRRYSAVSLGVIAGGEDIVDSVEDGELVVVDGEARHDHVIHLGPGRRIASSKPVIYL